MDARTHTTLTYAYTLMHERTQSARTHKYEYIHATQKCMAELYKQYSIQFSQVLKFAPCKNNLRCRFSLQLTTIRIKQIICKVVEVHC